MKKILILALALAYGQLFAQSWDKKFEQLGTTLPTPNSYRAADGAPGPDYWQQQADYTIDVRLDDNTQTITGSERITYYNNSPNTLKYMWLQLDQNLIDEDSDTRKITTQKIKKSYSGKALQALANDFDYDGGYNITKVTDSNNGSLTYTINKTMMRVELPKPLTSGDSFTFNVDWNFVVNDRMIIDERSGYEYFPEDGNSLYTIAQWFPRMAVYDDVEGWQNKQFLGGGEFALTFGNYSVSITVPADFIVASTGTLENAKDVLTSEQLKRFESAKKSFKDPVFIVTEEEARANEKSRTDKLKTWVFKADNVRDFAFASSRKFIWDAMAVDLGDNKPLAMSYYPKEGNPLWEEYSTRIVAHTLKSYSFHTINYPYPVAISVHTADQGMEYPMICFNWGRPDENGYYSPQTKYSTLGVIIHEVGHNFFPMIINSDERQWTWMDEGLNTFVQYLAEKEWDPAFPSRRGPAYKIVDYMKGDPEGMRPVMTNSEQILQFGNNAYGKPAAALNILRETVMGPELFDYAFKQYAERWAFKHPTPADFFRTMEDASAVDLDWFWKGWFYTTDNVDISISNVEWYKMDNNEKDVEKQVKASNKSIEGSKEQGELKFSSSPKSFDLTSTTDYEYDEFRSRLNDHEIKKSLMDKHFYEVTFENEGGLVMPIIIEWTFEDGSTEVEKIPAEVWRKNEEKVVKVFVKDKKVVNMQLDPEMETADVNVDNNVFPREKVPSAFDKFKDSKGK